MTQKACPGLDPGWAPVFGSDHAAGVLAFGLNAFNELGRCCKAPASKLAPNWHRTHVASIERALLGEFAPHGFEIAFEGIDPRVQALRDGAELVLDVDDLELAGLILARLLGDDHGDRFAQDADPLASVPVPAADGSGDAMAQAGRSNRVGGIAVEQHVIEREGDTPQYGIRD